MRVGKQVNTDLWSSVMVLGWVGQVLPLLPVAWSCPGRSRRDVYLDYMPGVRSLGRADAAKQQMDSLTRRGSRRRERVRGYLVDSLCMQAEDATRLHHMAVSNLA